MIIATSEKGLGPDVAAKSMYEPIYTGLFLQPNIVVVFIMCTYNTLLAIHLIRIHQRLVYNVCLTI